MLAFTGVLRAQPASPQPAAAADEGLETPWSIAPVLQEIGAHFGRLLAALNQYDAKAWVAKGASETYGEQLQSCKAQAKALSDGATALSRNPEQLAAALELFFRFQSLETMLGSVEEGMRKYQGLADAQNLAGLEAEIGPNRDRLQRYVVALAADRERQLKITDQEAQRCRALLTASPAPAPAKSGKKK
ncbi:MAG TPA: hypothetical protein VGS58_16505 [Candidatus Sulfopaludibacter sp.]|nr:hypothetical protein [Candidatus Sulfopaludibacter sp.]